MKSQDERLHTKLRRHHRLCIKIAHTKFFQGNNDETQLTSGLQHHGGDAKETQVLG